MDGRDKIGGSRQGELHEQVERLYLMHRDGFVGFARIRYNCTTEDALDIYQESFIVLYNNIRSGKVTDLRCSLKTYLFAIGKNLLLKRLSYPAAAGVEELQELTVSDHQSDGRGESERREIAGRVVREMEEPCSSVLRLYYWERKSMDDIAQRMNYKNGQVAKNRKSLCMRLLREKLTGELRKFELL